jgi:hypothetical protein
MEITEAQQVYVPYLQRMGLMIHPDLNARSNIRGNIWYNWAAARVLSVACISKMLLEDRAQKPAILLGKAKQGIKKSLVGSTLLICEDVQARVHILSSLDR